MLENEIFKFEEQICDFEEDLNSGANIPSEVRDTILTVIGMAKLLMAQKLTQFRGLCDKNIVSPNFIISEISNMNLVFCVGSCSQEDCQSITKNAT